MGSTREAAAESVADEAREAAPARTTEDPIEIGGPDPEGPAVPAGSTAAPPPAAAPEAAQVVAAPAAPITFQQLRDSWDEVLQQLAEQHRAAWMLVSNTTPVELRDGDVLVLGFQSDADVQRFREAQGGKPSVADLLRTAITSLLGIEVKYIPRTRQGQRVSGSATEQPSAADDDVHRAASAPVPSAAAPASASASAPATPDGRQASPAADGAITGWAVAVIPSDAEAPPEDLPEQPLPDEPEPDPLSFVSAPEAPVLPVSAPAKTTQRPAASGPSLDELAQSAPAPEPALSASQAARYGESVVREELGAELIEERPRVRGER